MADDPEWRRYEQQIAEVLREKLPGANVTLNASRLGKKSQTNRQIDVLVEEEIATASGTDTFVRVVDAKKWGESLDITDVQAFEGLVRDVGADMGMLVTTKGYSEAAKTYAENVGGIKLDVLAFEELKTTWEPPPLRGIYCEKCGFHGAWRLADGESPGYCPRDGWPMSVINL